MEDEIPSTKHLVLKPKEIEPINAISRPGDGQALSVELMHLQNRLAEEKAARRKKKGGAFPVPDSGPALPAVFKPKEIVPVNLPARPGGEEAIHVEKLLLENRVAEEEFDWRRFKHRKRRKSRRNRDFILWVGSFDLAVLGGAILMRSDEALIMGVSAIALVTPMAAWIMFFVMDDY